MKIHQYNEMMRHLTRREPSDKHLAAMPLYEQGGRVGYQSGQLVQPGPGRQGYSGKDIVEYDDKTASYRSKYKSDLRNPDGTKKAKTHYFDSTEEARAFMKESKTQQFRAVESMERVSKKRSAWAKKFYKDNIKKFKVSDYDKFTSKMANEWAKESKKGEYIDLQKRLRLTDNMGLPLVRGETTIFDLKAPNKGQVETHGPSKAFYKRAFFKGKLETDKKLLNGVKDYMTWATTKGAEGTPAAYKATRKDWLKAGAKFMDKEVLYLLGEGYDQIKFGKGKGTFYDVMSEKFPKLFDKYHTKINLNQGTWEKNLKQVTDLANRDFSEVYNAIRKENKAIKTLLGIEKLPPDMVFGFSGEHVGGLKTAILNNNKDFANKVLDNVVATTRGRNTELGYKLLEKPKNRLVREFNIAKSSEAKKEILRQINELQQTVDPGKVQWTINKGKLDFNPLGSSQKTVEQKAASYIDELKGSSEGKLFIKKNISDKKIKAVLKNLDIPYQGPGLSSFGAAGLDDLLKTVPAAKVGKFIKGIGLEFEPLFEGGFYEYFRRKGYTHDQAREETFFYKLANPDRTGIMEGADPLLERDLYQIKGENEFMDVDNRPPMQDPEFGKVIGERKSVKRYIDALKERDRINKILTEKQRGITTQRKDIQDRASEDVQDLARSGAYDRIKKILQPGSAESVAYNAAVEKQQTEQGVRGIEYGEWGQGDTERLAARREKERYRLMNKKFPSYTGPQIDQRLEEYGYYINPDNRYRHKAKSLKLIEGVGYDAISDYFKDQDKTAYFAENFREEKAAGGRIGFKGGSIDKGRRAFMKWLAGITGATIAGGTGLIKLSKGAKTVVPKVTEEVIKRGADGTPLYIADLIKVVKAKGIKKIMDSNINKYPDTVHSYKGVEVIDEVGGTTRIKRPTEGVATDSSTGKMHEGISKEVEMEIKPSDRDVYTDPESGMSWYIDEGKGTRVYETTPPDEYFEGTLRPDKDGKMTEVDEFIDDVDHLELKKIADEGTYDTSLPDIDDID